MPHFALHVLLASRVAEVIEVESPAPGDQIQRNAFLHGAVGPDMGFFPGGDHVLSLAAHGKRSGDLVRALHETAETPQHRAFVRGWLTHMLADILIHPIINRAAAELLERKRLTLTPAAEFHSHITVELGLDAVYVNRHRALRRIRLQPFFDDPTTRWITAAVQTAYGVYLEPSAVLRSHQQVVRLQRPLLLLEHLMGPSSRMAIPSPASYTVPCSYAVGCPVATRGATPGERSSSARPDHRRQWCRL